MSFSILLVEDDAPLAESIAGVFKAQGWHVDVSPRGEPVPRSVRQDDYDLLILDIGLPGIDGLETLRQVRGQGSVLPVLMLTARDGLDDRVHGLDVGADDYMVKPFAPKELLARVRALTRRHENLRAGVLTLGALRFDSAARRAWIGEQPCHLSARESVLLPYLMQNAGLVVTREQLVGFVPGWSGATSSNAMELLMSRLRAKIEPAGLRLRMIRGLGYLLEPDDAR